MNLSEFQRDDVLSFESYRNERGNEKEEKIVRISQFATKINVITQNRLPQFFNESLIDFLGLRLPNIHAWFQEGIDCAVLKLGSKSWCKGKLKINITVEFIPDPPELELQNDEITDEQSESPLDSIRQMMNDGTIDE